MSRVARFCMDWFQRWHLSLFEKVILVNSIMMVGEALAGLWVTSHNLEIHRYVIDTGFLVFATLLTLLINMLLLRASFRPLFSLLSTIRAVSTGTTKARAVITDSEIGELAQAFNSMLDRLETARSTQTMLILQAQEEERRRIALELHDETGQNLTALLIHAAVLKQKLQILPTPTISEDARKHIADGLDQLEQLTQLTLENIRILAQQLRPSVLDDLGLMAALRWLVEDSHQRLHLAVNLEVDERESTYHKLPPVYETTLFRIAQESLTNIARHAQAQQISVSLTYDQHYISLEIQDDGCGFNPLQYQTGSGMIGMRERATLLKGTLTIHSQPNQGTRVQVQLPFPKREPT